MHTQYPEESLNAQILEEASEWLVEFTTDAPDLAARRRFDAWLRRSPEHVRTYLELLPIWKQGTVAQFARDQGPEALIAYARTEGNVVPLCQAQQEPTRVGRSSVKRLKVRRLAMAAAALVALVGATFVWQAADRGTAYTTGIGEQRSVVLADGSTLELNTDSSVRTRFNERQRSIELLRGQALFSVAVDSRRPFVVDVGDTRVRAVGTQFDVYRKKVGTVVTVVEGRVVVSSASLPVDPAAPAAGALLSAGEQMAIPAAAPQGQLQALPANLAISTAWTQRRLVFDAAYLPQVVEEFNRYNTRQLVIADAALERFPITGTFSSTSPDSLIRFLQAQPGIAVQFATSGDQVRIFSR